MKHDGGWTRRASRYLFESRWFNLRQDEVSLPTGEQVTYTLVEHPGYVMVVPLLGDGRVILERVYRYTVQETVLECPSGGLDGDAPEQAARRELEEETRGIVNLTDVKYNYFRFTTKSLSHDEVRKERENGVDLTLVYHVYVIETELDRVDERNIISNFNIEKEKMDERRKNKQPIKRTYDENDFMAFDTLDEFKRRKVWSLIRENVINNPDFQVALTSKNRESFYLKNH